MAENRSETRNSGYAKVIVDAMPGYLRNLTESGCKILTMSALKCTVNDTVPLQILPDETSGLGRITLTARLCWEKQEETGFLYGFSITAFSAPGNAAVYKKLVSLHNPFHARS